jgi:hypothetical protein
MMMASRQLLGIGACLQWRAWRANLKENELEHEEYEIEERRRRVIKDRVL